MSKISQSSYSMGCSRRPFQILGDGEDLAVIMEEESGEQVAYIFKGVLVSKFTTAIVDQPMLDFETFGSPFRSSVITGPPNINVELELRANGFEHATGGNLLLDLDIFNKRSVREILQIINRKLKVRDRD